MITIKEKNNRTQIYIPRDAVGTTYLTYSDLQQFKDKVVEEYVTKEYIGEKIGLIDNKLEEILG